MDTAIVVGLPIIVALIAAAVAALLIARLIKARNQPGGTDDGSGN